MILQADVTGFYFAVFEQMHLIWYSFLKGTFLFQEIIPWQYFRYTPSEDHVSLYIDIIMMQCNWMFSFLLRKYRYKFAHKMWCALKYTACLHKVLALHPTWSSSNANVRPIPNVHQCLEPRPSPQMLKINGE